MSTDASPGESRGTGDTNYTLQLGARDETVPVQEIVTGRGFITGKSGAGKSNSVTVLLEELLDLGLPALVVDTDGEYHPLTDRYQVLHVGPGEECDTDVDEDDADRLATLALENGIPVVLDVSEHNEEDARATIEAVVRALFERARQEKRPYLVVVEEIQEYLPQRGTDDLADLLTTVAKRGRKHGLGIIGASQRPSSVDKDFVTQASWVVWHRLTYETDKKSARKTLGKEYADALPDLSDGEAFLQADWLEAVQTLQFRQKYVHDAGATPDVAPYIERAVPLNTEVVLNELHGEGEEGDEEESTLGFEPGERPSARDVHREAVVEIVREHFGVTIGELYDEYADRVATPRGKRSVRGYLSDLRDAGAVVFAGETKGREYYPWPEGVEVPEQVSPTEVVYAVGSADTVSDVQRDLSVSRGSAREIAAAFDHVDVDARDDAEGQTTNSTDDSSTMSSESKTVRTGVQARERNLPDEDLEVKQVRVTFEMPEEVVEDVLEAHGELDRDAISDRIIPVPLVDGKPV